MSDETLKRILELSDEIDLYKDRISYYQELIRKISIAIDDLREQISE